MALNFPDNPSVNDIYRDSTSGFAYQWDGTVWQSYSDSSLGQIKSLDDISGSFNGSTQTFALTSNSTAVTPANAQQIRVVLGGIVQDPADDYTVSGSDITFTTPPTGGLSFSGIVFGTAVPINTIVDGTVTDGSLRISTQAIVGSATTFTEDLVVEGDARITGILTVGTGSVTINGSTNQINVGSGVTIYGNTGIISATSITVSSTSTSTLGVTTTTSLTSQQLNVSGVSTLGVTTTTSLTSQQLNVSGVSTLGTVRISSGIVTSTTGIVTYYGDGSKLSNVISGVGIATAGGTVGTGATVLDFRGSGISTVTVSSGIATINIQSGKGSFSPINYILS